MKEPNKFDLGYIGNFILGLACGAVVSAVAILCYEFVRFLMTH